MSNRYIVNLCTFVVSYLTKYRDDVSIPKKEFEYFYISKELETGKISNGYWNKLLFVQVYSCKIKLTQLFNDLKHIWCFYAFTHVLSGGRLVQFSTLPAVLRDLF